jgi:hypothetical protein
VVPQWLSKQARWDSLRSHVGEIARLAATVVDGDLHAKLLDPANFSDELYKRALAPLVRFHSADPDIFYLYTMVERDGVAYFVLDTAASPDLKTDRKLEASGYMQRFDVREEYNDDWLKQLAAGKTYVNPTFEEDDYAHSSRARCPSTTARAAIAALSASISTCSITSRRKRAFAPSASAVSWQLCSWRWRSDIS